jgi:hypothetical protein
MGQLVLLVVAAAWAAVLIPPLLRSRVDNRPNSSVTDFRRQLNRLQSTVPARAGGSFKPMGRQLAPSPLQRPVAGGRPAERMAWSASLRSTHRSRIHEDQSGPQRRHRTTQVSRSSASAGLRRRRANVLFVLVVAAACTLFLAATTKSTVMLTVFAVTFLSLCGYMYLLAQLRQREQQSWPAAWPREHAAR